MLVRVPAGDEWETRFVMRLEEPLRFGAAADRSKSEITPADWARDASPGDPYPFVELPIIEDALRFKRKSGGVISKKVRGGEMYARGRERASDKEKGADAEHLVALVQDLHNRGHAINKIEINNVNHAVFREAGKLFFVCALKQGLEFPEREHDVGCNP